MAIVVSFLVVTPIMALGLSFAVKLLGLFWGRCETSGPGGFKALYLRFLIIAAVQFLVSLLGVPAVVQLVIVVLMYKFIFDADWIVAVVVGTLGGLLAFFMVVFALVGLAYMGFPL